MAESGATTFLSWTNFERGIRINYPAGWTYQEQSAAAGWMVGFLSPPEDENDRFSENVNLYVEPLPAGLGTEMYVQGCLQAMKQAPFRFLESAWCRVAGRRAYRHVYEGPLNTPIPLSGRYLQYFLVEHAQGYVVTYTAELQKFDRYLAAAEQMIASLEIR
jgi:serine/threonine-protein kinase